MSQLKTNISDIKIVAKNLAEELRAMKFNITHSTALNLISRSLGFNNYNTYKASFGNAAHIKSDSEISETFKKNPLTKFASLNHRFLKLESIDDYDIFIHKDTDNLYYLIFRLHHSYTKKIYYCPQDDTFKLNIYSNCMYQVKLEMVERRHLHSLFFNKLLHLQRTKNISKEVILDLSELMDNIFNDREKLIQISNHYSKLDLHVLWQSKNKVSF